MSPAAAPAPPGASAALDPLGVRAPKLGALLGVPRGARVLAAGAPLAGWAEDLAAWFDAEWAPAPDPARLARGCGLVLWAPSPAETGEALAAALAAIRAALAPLGSLLLLARNALSLRGLAHGAPGLVGSGARTAAGYRRALRAAGFARVDAFAAVPSLDAAEEFVAPATPVPLPHAGRVERMVAAAGLLRLVHDGFAFVASGEGGGLSALVHALDRGGHGPAPVVERFALRARGALVLRVRAGGRPLACRVAAAGPAARAVGRNAAWTRRLRACAALDPWARERIPRPFATLPLGDALLFPERAVDGVVGWMLSPARRDVLWADLARFSLLLHRATARARRVDAAALERLLPGALPAHAAGVGRAYLEVRAALAARLGGRVLATAWAHGDFGHGNAIAEPRSGRLAGVIDWDQATRDAAGVDLLNAAVQRHNLDSGHPYGRAFAEVAGRFAAGGFAAAGAPDFDAALPLSAARRAELAAWTALRVVRRGAQYASLFPASEPTSAALLREAAALLARHPAAEGRG